MSAMPFTIDSLNSARHCVEFQLLKPIGGVRANPLSRAAAGLAVRATTAIPPAARPAAATTARTPRDNLLMTANPNLRPATVPGRGDRGRRGGGGTDGDGTPQCSQSRPSLLR